MTDLKHTVEAARAAGIPLIHGWSHFSSRRFLGEIKLRDMHTYEAMIRVKLRTTDRALFVLLCTARIISPNNA
jgi:hypothetical protein